MCDRAKGDFPGKKAHSHSFDKGFWSKDNLAAPQAAQVGRAVLPKRGRHNKGGKARESHPGFKKLRNAHSAVESNINMLEHHGPNRCMDKGLGGFKRCVGLSVPACNPHILGNATKAKELAREARREKARLRQAA